MAIFYLTLSFVFITLSNANGPDCITKKCVLAPYILEATNGEIDCRAKEDCCGCKEIVCNSCREVSCTNKRSCGGTRIVINGNENSGAQLLCNAPNGCISTTIDATNIVEIDCDEKYACKNSKMTLNKNIVTPTDLEGLVINCNAAESCLDTSIVANNIRVLSCRETYSCQRAIGRLIGNERGLKIDCHGRISCSENRFDFTEVSDILCTGIMSCAKARFYGTCNGYEGCSINCDERSACVSSIMETNNVNIINCVGTWACIYSQYFIKGFNDEKGLKINCYGDKACGQTLFNVTNVHGIDCIGDNACIKTVMNIIGNKGGEFVCHGKNACQDAIINNLNNVESITCSDRDACGYAQIIGTGNEKTGCAITCMDYGACLYSNIKMTKVNSIECNEEFSCGKATFDVSVYDKSFALAIMAQRGAQFSVFNIKIPANVDSIKSIQCAEQSACDSAIFEIDASQSDKKCLIESIECMFGACLNTVFRLINACIKRDNVKCGNVGNGLLCVGATFECLGKDGLPLPLENCVV